MLIKFIVTMTSHVAQISQVAYNDCNNTIFCFQFQGWKMESIPRSCHVSWKTGSMVVAVTSDPTWQSWHSWKHQCSCHHCDSMLILRDVQQLSKINLNDGNFSEHIYSYFNWWPGFFSKTIFYNNELCGLKQKHEVSSNRALKFRSDMLTNYLTRLSQPSQLLHNRHKRAYEAFYLNSQANGLSWD